MMDRLDFLLLKRAMREFLDQTGEDFALDLLPEALLDDREGDLPPPEARDSGAALIGLVGLCHFR